MPPVFSYKLRYIVGFGLVEMVISTNPKPTILYPTLYGIWGLELWRVIEQLNYTTVQRQTAVTGYF